MSLPPVPSDEDTASMRRPHAVEAEAPEDGTTVINGTKFKHVPWWGALVALLVTNSGTAVVGALMSADWFGIKARSEAADLELSLQAAQATGARDLQAAAFQCQIDLIRCGCDPASISSVKP